MSNNMNRYGVVREKNKREIVLLRGSGCKWKKCRFCDYHNDYGKSETENYELNKEQLDQVTGEFEKLEIINSGSFVDLDEKTMDYIEEVCREKRISEVHFECHWSHREEIHSLRQRFKAKNIMVKVKIGVETFHSRFRESYLDKGIDTDSPDEIRKYFDEVCLLFGLPGQTTHSMERDIEIGLQFFERICVNIMQANTKPIQPDPWVIHEFQQNVYPTYKENPRVDILLSNTDFGVGGM